MYRILYMVKKKAFFPMYDGLAYRITITQRVYESTTSLFAVIPYFCLDMLPDIWDL